MFAFENRVPKGLCPNPLRSTVRIRSPDEDRAAPAAEMSRVAAALDAYLRNLVEREGLEPSTPAL